MLKCAFDCPFNTFERFASLREEGVNAPFKSAKMSANTVMIQL